MLKIIIILLCSYFGTVLAHAITTIYTKDGLNFLVCNNPSNETINGVVKIACDNTSYNTTMNGVVTAEKNSPTLFNNEALSCAQQSLKIAEQKNGTTP